MNVLANRFSDFSHPREDGKVIHPLTDVLIIAVCAAIAGAERYEDIVLYGKSKTSWLGEFLDLGLGIPSHDTFRRNPRPDRRGGLRGMLHQVGQLAGGGSRRRGPSPSTKKTIRRSFDPGKEQSPLHVVSAWASEQSLVLTQEAQEEKSNEITAIPEVLEAIELEGALVTIDAMGCQTDIAEEILEEKADYLLALKAIPETAYRAVQAHFEE
jgi:hypothetical protein